MIVHCTPAAMNVAKPALLAYAHFANGMMSSFAVYVTIGFTLLTLARNSLAILPTHMLALSQARTDRQLFVSWR
jgi:hypothetical protein